MRGHGVRLNTAGLSEHSSRSPGAGPSPRKQSQASAVLGRLRPQPLLPAAHGGVSQDSPLHPSLLPSFTETQRGGTSTTQGRGNRWPRMDRSVHIQKEPRSGWPGLPVKAGTDPGCELGGGGRREAGTEGRGPRPAQRRRRRRGPAAHGKPAAQKQPLRSRKR